MPKKKKTKDADKGKAKVESFFQNKDKDNPHLSCYICNGPYLLRNYLNKSKLNAIMMKNGQDGESDSDGPQKVVPLQLLDAIHAMKAKIHPKLIFGYMEVNGYQISTMVDTCFS